MNTHICVACDRSVALGDKVVRTTAGPWVHLGCAAGDGPVPADPVIVNHEHYYVTVVDPDNLKRRGVLLGPFPTHDEAKQRVDQGRRLAEKANPWAAFYAFGVASSNAILKPVFGDKDVED